jgi:hypothetical protein
MIGIMATNPREGCAHHPPAHPMMKRRTQAQPMSEV